MPEFPSVLQRLQLASFVSASSADGILDGSRFWLFPRVLPGLSHVKFQQEFASQPVVTGRISVRAEARCWGTPCLDFQRCPIAAAFWLRLTFQVTCQSPGVFRSLAFVMKTDIICAGVVLPGPSTYLPLCATDLGGSTLRSIDWHSYFWVAHSKIHHPKLFSSLKWDEWTVFQLHLQGNFMFVLPGEMKGSPSLSFCDFVSKMMCENMTKLWLPKEQIKSRGH